MARRLFSDFIWLDDRLNELTMGDYHELFAIYQSMRANNDRDAIRRLNVLFDRNSVNMNRGATAMVLLNVQRNHHYYLLTLRRAIPYDIRRSERLKMISNIPRFFRNNSAIMRVVARLMAYIVTEPGIYIYRHYKDEFARFLLCFPHSACTTILNDYISDLNRIQVLTYLELHVRPDWTLLELQQINNAYVILASRVKVNLMEAFLRLIMVSEDYCYHSMMAALTPHAESGQLKIADAIQFMREKHISCVDNIRIGIVNEFLKSSIETQFVTALLRRMNVYGIDRVMSLFQKQDIVNDTTLEDIAKTHIRELDVAMNQQPDSHAMIFITRQAALTKYAPEFKDRILERTLRFGEEKMDIMNETQCRVFCSIVCTLGYPKQQCRQEGSDKLFSFLFNRLMQSLPRLGRTDERKEFNNMQTILYCLHSLFSINQQCKTTMENLDRLWAHKICHAVDLNMVTSSNMNYDMSRITDRKALKKLRREIDVINSTGQLLVYMLGLLQTERLRLDMPHLSRKSYYRDDTFTDLFTKSLNIDLTKTQRSPGPPIRFSHRRAIGLVEINFDSDGEEIPEDPTMDSDSDSDSDDNDSNDEPEEDDPEEEEMEDVVVGEEPAEEDDVYEDVDDEDDDDASSVVSEYTIGSSDDEDDDDDDELEWEQFLNDERAGLLRSIWETRRQENVPIRDDNSRRTDERPLYLGISSFVVFMASAVSTIQTSLDINDDYELF